MLLEKCFSLGRFKMSKRLQKLQGENQLLKEEIKKLQHALKESKVEVPASPNTLTSTSKTTTPSRKRSKSSTDLKKKLKKAEIKTTKTPRRSKRSSNKKKENPKNSKNEPAHSVAELKAENPANSDKENTQNSSKDIGIQFSVEELQSKLHKKGPADNYKEEKAPNNEIVIQASYSNFEDPDIQALEKNIQTLKDLSANKANEEVKSELSIFDEFQKLKSSIADESQNFEVGESMSELPLTDLKNTLENQRYKSGLSDHSKENFYKASVEKLHSEEENTRTLQDSFESYYESESENIEKLGKTELSYCCYKSQHEKGSRRREKTLMSEIENLRQENNRLRLQLTGENKSSKTTEVQTTVRSKTQKRGRSKTRRRSKNRSKSKSISKQVTPRSLSATRKLSYLGKKTPKLSLTPSRTRYCRLCDKLLSKGYSTAFCSKHGKLLNKSFSSTLKTHKTEK